MDVAHPQGPVMSLVILIVASIVGSLELVLRNLSFGQDR